MSLDDIATRDKLFQKILFKELKNESIKNVVLINKQAATKKGDNYLSCLTRFTLKYTTNKNNNEKLVHLIMKEEPIAAENVLDHIRELNIFNTEREILEHVIPKIEELIDKRLGAKLYYSSSTPATIVMEDLAALGFRNKNRKLGFEKKEILMVLENLADFHAGSIFLNEKNPGSTSHFTSGIITDKLPEALRKIIGDTLITIADAITLWEDKRFIKIAQKLKRLSGELIDDLMGIYKSEPNEFCVLNHGDLWINNMMFKENDDGEVQEIRFVDYQMSIWTSPAIDLHYFLSINPTLDLKFDHDDEFLQEYLNHLTRMMKRIGCLTKPPTMEQLKKSFHKHRLYAVMAGLTFYPKIIAEDNEIDTLDNMIDGGKSTIDFMKNPMCQATLKKILPIMDERGYFD